MTCKGQGAFESHRLRACPGVSDSGGQRGPTYPNNRVHFCRGTRQEDRGPGQAPIPTKAFSVLTPLDSLHRTSSWRPTPQTWHVTVHHELLSFLPVFFPHQKMTRASRAVTHTDCPMTHWERRAGRLTCLARGPPGLCQSRWRDFYDMEQI